VIDDVTEEGPLHGEAIIKIPSWESLSRPKLREARGVFKMEVEII
jgi:hypothetical protein